MSTPAVTGSSAAERLFFRIPASDPFATVVHAVRTAWDEHGSQLFPRYPFYPGSLAYPPERTTVRRATPADSQAVVAGLNAICAEGGAFYVTRFIPDAQWEAVLSQPESVPDHLLIVAEVDGQFAGAAQLFPGPHHSVFHHVAELGIFLLPPYRHHGVGSLLMGHLISNAHSVGIEKITLVVFANNRPALHLYQKFGFAEEGRRRCQFKLGDAYVDEVLMARFLAHPPRRSPSH